jgi:D-amino-acid dehydrogenase
MTRVRRKSRAETPGTSTVAVIGAGIVGVCIAHELRKRGHEVTLIDRDEPGRGCSFGNSGAISPSSVAPLAMPGIIASIPSMLHDRESPLYLPWRYLPTALPWLMRFVTSALPSRVARSSTKLAALHANAVERHVALAHEVGVPELVVRRGHLHLYPDQSALDKDAASWRLRDQHGYRFEKHDRHGILALEPNVGTRYQIGMYLDDHATVVNPFRYVRAIARAFTDNGGNVLRARVRSLRMRRRMVWVVQTDNGDLDFTHVVVATGAWSRSLLDPLGIRVAVETQRGYHVQFSGAAPITRTVVLADRKIFMTPMEDGLRVGGTVEIAGLRAPPNMQRAELLVRVAKETFARLDERDATTWMGHRPCMPDSVPVIGRAKRHRGLFIAVGHGHLGLTDSAHTAERIASALDTAAALAR